MEGLSKDFNPSTSSDFVASVSNKTLELLSSVFDLIGGFLFSTCKVSIASKISTFEYEFTRLLASSINWF